jgi:hypothetical protein
MPAGHEPAGFCGICSGCAAVSSDCGICSGCAAVSSDCGITIAAAAHSVATAALMVAARGLWRS